MAVTLTAVSTGIARPRTVAALLASVAVLASVAAACSTARPAPATSPAPTVSTSSPAPVDPVSVPLAVDGSRLVLDIGIGGRVLHVLVDTGSSGLRLAASRVPPGSATPLGPAPPYAYVSGIRLAGTTARAPLRIGNVPSAAPVPLELVTGADCLPEHPDCGAANGHTPGIVGGRFDGIIGLSALSGDTLPNPLWYLGDVGHAYGVRYDPSGRSALLLGLPADGFAVQQLRRHAAGTDHGTGPPAWEPHYDLCAVTDLLPGGRLCAPGGLDTGNPALADLHLPGGPDLTLPPGTPLSVGTSDGRWSADYLTGPGRTASLTTSRSSALVGLGLPALAGSELRIDLAAGTIGLRRR